MTSAKVVESPGRRATVEQAGPVLVALKPFDGREGPVVMARWLATRRHAELHAMSVIEMGDIGSVVAGLPPLPVEFYERERVEVANGLRARLMTPGGSNDARVDVVEGPPGSMVANTGATRHASTIVIGTGQHGMLGRFLYGERALEVVRTAEGVVLVVPPHAEPPIERAIVAVDFSQASVRAAAAALGMIDAGGHLTLVHVESAVRRVDDRAIRAELERERRTRALFGSLLDVLPAVADVRIDTLTLRGDAVGALLRYAEEEEVDLVACGRRRHSITERLLVGSVSTALVRGAPCCVLVAPERPEDDELGANDPAAGESRPVVDPAPRDTRAERETRSGGCIVGPVGA